MAGLSDYTPLPPLRSLDEARLCIYLGNNLTEEEVKQYTDQLLAGGIPCRTCGGQIPGYHCSHELAGPFTRIAGKCNACTHWRGNAVTENAEPAVS